nr:hypothetical protein [Thermodesulfobacterium thermophilum]
MKEPKAPAITRGNTKEVSQYAVLMCGIREEKEGGVNAQALMPAAFFGSMPTIIRVGISKNPGLTPRNPLKTDIGTASIRAKLKFSFDSLFLGGLKSL